MVFVTLQTTHTTSEKEPIPQVYELKYPKKRFFPLHESIRESLIHVTRKVLFTQYCFPRLKVGM